MAKELQKVSIVLFDSSNFPVFGDPFAVCFSAYCTGVFTKFIWPICWLYGEHIRSDYSIARYQADFADFFSGIWSRSFRTGKFRIGSHWTLFPDQTSTLFWPFGGVSRVFSGSWYSRSFNSFKLPHRLPAHWDLFRGEKSYFNFWRKLPSLPE